MVLNTTQGTRGGEALKALVKHHWEHESCGARNGQGETDRKRFFEKIEKVRYAQDYMIQDFADFPSAQGKKVLEVGLGTGSDFMNWCRAGAEAYGRDLTESAVAYVKERLQMEELAANVAQGDAEALDFSSDFFDIYYSWGVLHHTADPRKAFSEAYRVLKPGGVLKIMLYHYYSAATLLVWMAHGPLKLKFVSPRECVFHNVESAGTKMFSRADVLRELEDFFAPESIEMRTYLGAGDLLSHTPSAKYQSKLWKGLIAIYPTRLVKLLLSHRFGSVLTIRAVKSACST